MESKVCKGCRLEKYLEEFTNNKQAKSGKSSKCKKCNAKMMREYVAKNKESVKANNIKSWNKHKKRRLQEDKEYYKANKKTILTKFKSKYNANSKKYIDRSTIYYYSLKDGLYHVYILPEEHYCGQTDCFIIRERRHRYSNKITHNMEVVMSFKTRKEAKQLEKAFHKVGWYGENELHSGNYKYA